MNQDPNIQGNPYAQQKINSQPILSSLANPTPFHLKALSQRSNNGAPPTPNNSFQNNNTLSDGTLDPQSLPYQQQQFMNIKQESAHQDFDDLDTANPMSPLSTTACNSPHEQGFISPSANSFDDLCRSYKPTSTMDMMMGGGGSANPLPTNSFSANSFTANSYTANSYTANSLPPNSLPPNSLSTNTFYDNIPTDNYSNDDYIFASGEIAMSAPVTSPIGVDVKANNSQKINYNSRNLHNNLNNFGPHSVPTIPNVSDWQQYGASLDSTPLQYQNSGEIQGFEPIENDKDALQNEKRRRRRESHNAVERRRRDNINEKIQELSTLLPDLYVDSSNKPNKGVILRKSVDYIRHLQHLFEQERSRSSKLESQVRELASKTGNNPGSSSNGSDLNNSSGNGNLYGSSMP